MRGFQTPQVNLETTKMKLKRDIIQQDHKEYLVLLNQTILTHQQVAITYIRQ
jgi:hypothetical protein